MELSNWLLAISIFLFLSLALVKRCAELEEATQEDAALAPGRGYHPSDLPSLRAMGMASGFLAVMVLALYVDSQNGRALYAEPCPPCFLPAYPSLRRSIVSGVRLATLSMAQPPSAFSRKWPPEPVSPPL